MKILVYVIRDDVNDKVRDIVEATVRPGIINSTFSIDPWMLNNARRLIWHELATDFGHGSDLITETYHGFQQLLHVEKIYK